MPPEEHGGEPRIVELDETSLLVDVDVELRVGALAEQLAEHNLLLGGWARHAPATATLAELLAQRSPALASPRGHFLDAIVTATLLLADDKLARGTLAPRRAVGPDPVRFLVGSTQGGGRPLRVVLRVERRSEVYHRLAAELDSLEAGLAVADALWRAEVRPLQQQLRWDKAGRAAPRLTFSILIAGPRPLAEYERALVTEQLRAHGARPSASYDERTFADPKLSVVGQGSPGVLLACAEALRLGITKSVSGAWSLLLDAFTEDGAALGVRLGSGPPPDELLSSLRSALTEAGGRPLGFMPPQAIPAPIERQVLQTLDPNDLFAPGGRDAGPSRAHARNL